MNKIYNIDCLEFLKTIPDKSADLVIVDPPYYIGFDGGKGWDSQWVTEKEYLDWCISWTQECIRVLKDNRMFIVWGTLKTDTFLKYKLLAGKNKDIKSQNEIIWSYNWGGRTKSNFARKHEYAWCWSKGDTYLFNAHDVKVERKMKTSYRTGKEYKEGTIPTCVWEKNNMTVSKDHIGWHPTTKNLEVLERMIRAYTNPNDLVLDCFMGSGSTAVAAIRSGRHYVGTELDAEYYIKLTERISIEQGYFDTTPEVWT